MFPPKLEFTIPPRNIIISGEYILYITSDLFDITTVRLDRCQIPSSRIDFVREIIINSYSIIMGTPNKIKSKFKKKTKMFVL